MWNKNREKELENAKKANDARCRSLSFLSSFGKNAVHLRSLELSVQCDNLRMQKMDQADIDKEIKVDNEMWEEVRLFQKNSRY